MECNTKLQKQTEKEGNKIKEKTSKIKKKYYLNSFRISIENPMNNFDVKIVITSKCYLRWSFKSTIRRKKTF